MPTDQHPTDPTTEDRLRAQLAGLAAPGRLDTGAIIRRSRRRRRAGTLTVVAASTLAIAGIAVATVGGPGSPLPTTMTASDGMAESSTLDAENLVSPDAAGDGIGPAERLSTCGTQPAEVTPNSAGLLLSPAFPGTASADDGEQQGTVILRNTGTARIRGTVIGPPAITIARDGVTRWHSPEPQAAEPLSVDLAPGDEASYDARYLPVQCDEDHETSVSEPALPPGDYTLSAAIVFEPDDGSAPQVISGPALPLTLE